MLWEIEILPKLRDPETERVRQELALLTHGRENGSAVTLSSRGYLVEGDLTHEQAARLLHSLLLDPLAERGRVGQLNSFNTVERDLKPTAGASLSGQLKPTNGTPWEAIATVLLKPGVMDPVAESVAEAAHDLGLSMQSVRTFRRYYASEPPAPAQRELLFHRILANDAIEQVIAGPLHVDHLTLDSLYVFRLVVIPVL